MKAELKTIHGEPSWEISTPEVRLALTRRGGMMSARFKVGRQWKSPYALAPWTPEECPGKQPPLLQVLRGDFFCLPFGVSKGVKMPHGDTANRAWSLREAGEDYLICEMNLKEPAGGRVEKAVVLKPGERAVYQAHVVGGLKGRYNFGHHPVLQFPGQGGPFPVRTSPFAFGQVYPGDTANPAAGEYAALKAGAVFRTLKKVPLREGGHGSLESYPAREGYEDIVMLAGKDKDDLGWTAVTLDGYVWLGLRNTAQLPSTLFWMSNGGRHQEPWCGQHRARMGIEDVCSHFHDGAQISAKEPLKDKGIRTSRAFTPKKPAVFRHIQLVHPVKKDFGAVKSVKKNRDGTALTLRSESGAEETVPVQWKFLFEEA